MMTTLINQEKEKQEVMKMVEDLFGELSSKCSVSPHRRPGNTLFHPLKSWLATTRSSTWKNPLQRSQQGARTSQREQFVLHTKIDVLFNIETLQVDEDEEDFIDDEVLTFGMK